MGLFPETDLRFVDRGVGVNLGVGCLYWRFRVNNLRVIIFAGNLIVVVTRRILEL